jgi:hypothetical protein
MAPLSCASLSDLYGTDFGNNATSSGQHVLQNTLRNNEKCARENSKYQNFLKENEIAGRANFKETYPKSTFGNLNGTDTNIPPRVSNKENNESNDLRSNDLRSNDLRSNDLRSTNFGPQPAPMTENESRFARRLAWTDKVNSWPSNQGFSMFNRFQGAFGNREDFGNLTDSECIQRIATLIQEILFVLKIIMLVLILLFVIKILQSKG